MGQTAFDPLGISVETEDSEIVQEELEVSSDTFGEMRRRFKSPNNAFAYLLFVLIYMPCVAVIATIYREIGGRWAIFSVLYLTILAWIISTLFYQTSQFLVQPAVATMWISVCLLIMISFVIYLKIWARQDAQENTINSRIHTPDQILAAWSIDK